MFDSLFKNATAKHVKEVRSKTLLCCSRIEQVAHPELKATCIQYQKLIKSCMLKGDYGEAKPLADTLLTSMSKEKWYRLLRTYLLSVREHFGKHVAKPSDIPNVAHQAICSVIFSVRLASSDLEDLKAVGKVLVKLCGKDIDARVNERGFTQKLLQGKADILHFVDVNIVSLYPSGNWQTSPDERHDLVLNMCRVRNISIRDMDEFRRVMLGGLASAGPSTTVSSRTASVDHIGRKNSEHVATPASSHTASEPFEEDVFVNGTKKGRGKKKVSETWETVFDRNKNTGEDTPSTPPPPSVVTTHDGWEFGTREDSPNTSGSSVLPPPMDLPGWGPPKPKLDDTYSFGRKLDNFGGYMKNKNSDELF